MTRKMAKCHWSHVTYKCVNINKTFLFFMSWLYWSVQPTEFWDCMRILFFLSVGANCHVQFGLRVRKGATLVV